MGELQRVDTTELRQLKAWVEGLIPRLGERHLVLLEGPVGAGKTQLVRFACEALGLADDEIASPTYAILHHYENSKHALDHVDLYRLESEDDLESTGFWDLFSQKTGLIFIEWSDYLDYSFLPRNWPKTRVKLQVEPGQRRSLEWQRLS